MKVGDKVRIVSNFESPNQEDIKQNSIGRVCAINEYDKIATVDFGNGLPVVPIDLLKKVGDSNSQSVDIGDPIGYIEVDDGFGPVNFNGTEPDTLSDNFRSLRFNKGKLPMHLDLPTRLISVSLSYYMVLNSSHPFPNSFHHIYSYHILIL